MRIGVLLAAGRGSRFDPDGSLDKLLAPVRGRPVALHALAALASAVDTVVAVVRPGTRGERVAQVLQPAGCEIVVCEQADSGMGHSLACAAARASAFAPDSLLVMLGDMPFVRADTMERVAAAVRSDDDIAAAGYRGRRGHPVAFGRAHFQALCALTGDRGAAELLRRHPPRVVDTDDPGVLQDVDTAADLPAAGT